MRKPFVCVFGAARSGTSLTTHLLYEMGMYLGEESEIVLPQNGINPEGFFEREDISNITGMVKSFYGKHDSNFLQLPSTWQTDLERWSEDISISINKIYKPGRICGVKNNSIAMLFPMWKAVFEKERILTKCVFVVRHPWEVALSQHKAWNVPMEQALVLWYYTVLNTMENIDDYDHLFIDYNELINNTRSVVEKISAFVGCSNDIERISGIVKSRMRHNKTIAAGGLYEELYYELCNYVKADIERNEDLKCKAILAYKSYKEQVDSLYNPRPLSMEMEIIIIDKIENRVVYEGVCQWGINNNISFFENFDRKMQLKKIEIILSSQTIGLAYAKKYKIKTLMVNGVDTVYEIKKKPNVMDLRFRIKIDVESPITEIRMESHVIITPYNNWFMMIRNLLPVSFRNLVRKVGLKN